MNNDKALNNDSEANKLGNELINWIKKIHQIRSGRKRIIRK
jgi:hypothetical protein